MIQNLKKKRSLPFAFFYLAFEVSREPQHCINFCPLVTAQQKGSMYFPGMQHQSMSVRESRVNLTTPLDMHIWPSPDSTSRGCPAVLGVTAGTRVTM